MTAKHDLVLSVVIPAYNEERRVGPSLETVRTYCEKNFAGHEVIVVDDGSLDGTASLVRQLQDGWEQLRLVSLDRNQGKGWATRAGVLAARGDYILCSDADLSTPIDELEHLLPRTRWYPVVIGSRSIPGARIARPQPPLRSFMGRVFNWYAQVTATAGYADTQCGFKLYRRDAARDIFGRLVIRGFAFDVEVLYLAHKLGYPVCEVPVVWLNDARSTVSLVTDPIQMFVDVLTIRWRHRRVDRHEP